MRRTGQRARMFVGPPSPADMAGQRAGSRTDPEKAGRGVRDTAAALTALRAALHWEAAGGPRGVGVNHPELLTGAA